MTVTSAWAEAEKQRAQHEFEAAQLAQRLRCEVVPHPLLAGKYEAKYDGGAMIGTAADLRASRRAQMLTWLLFFQAVGRDVTRPRAARPRG